MAYKAQTSVTPATADGPGRGMVQDYSDGGRLLGDCLSVRNYTDSSYAPGDQVPASLSPNGVQLEVRVSPGPVLLPSAEQIAARERQQRNEQWAREAEECRRQNVKTIREKERTTQAGQSWGWDVAPVLRLLHAIINGNEPDPRLVEWLDREVSGLGLPFSEETRDSEGVSNG